MKFSDTTLPELIEALKDLAEARVKALRQTAEFFKKAIESCEKKAEDAKDAAQKPVQKDKKKQKGKQ